MPEKDYKINVYDTIDKKISLNFWLAIITLLSTILGVGWYVGKNDTVDTQQSSDIENNTKKIETIETKTNELTVDVRVLQGVHK